MAYSRKTSIKKSGSGAIDGGIAGIVTVLIVGLIKTNISDMSQDMENAVASVIGLIGSAIVVGAKRFIGNWLKHRDKPTPASTNSAK